MEVLEASTNNSVLSATLGLEAQQSGIDTVTGGSGADTIDISAYTTLATTLGGGAGNDTITGGAAADSISGGAGNDTISVTEATGVTAVDTISFAAAASNGVDTISGFETGSDVLRLEADDTTMTTAAGNAAAVVLKNGAALLALGATFDATGLVNPAADDVVELLGLNYDNGNLGATGVTDGTELLKLMGVTGSAATSITLDANSNAYYFVAYDNGNAYIYDVDAGANAIAVASEITLVGVVTGIAVGGLAAADFAVG